MNFINVSYLQSLWARIKGIPTNTLYTLNGSSQTIKNAIDDLGSTFTSTKKGLVPAPGSGNTGKYLKGDGTWSTISVDTSDCVKSISVNGDSSVTPDSSGEVNLTIDTYTLEIDSEGSVPDVFTDNSDGLVPSPGEGNTDKFLKSDGTWSTVSTADEKVKQANSTSSELKKVLISKSSTSTPGGSITAATDEAQYCNGVEIQPSTGYLYANKLYSGGTEVSVSGHTHTTSMAVSANTSSITLNYDTAYALTAGGSDFIFKMPAAPSNHPVTSVAGKTGAVTLTSSDVGLGNVGNFKAVSTVASQGLSSTEKSNARNNIDAPSTLYAVKKCVVRKGASGDAFWVKVGSAVVYEGDNTANYECTIMMGANWHYGNAQNVFGIFKIMTRNGSSAGSLEWSKFKWLIRPVDVTNIIWSDSVRAYYRAEGSTTVVDLWVCLKESYVSFDFTVLSESKRTVLVNKMVLTSSTSDVTSSSSPSGTMIDIEGPITLQNPTVYATRDSEGNVIKDTYLKLAGGVMAAGATIKTPNSSDSRYSLVTNNGITTYGSSTSGWASGLTSYSSGGTNHMVIGTYGNADSINYAYIGTDYNTSTLKVIPGTGVGVSGSLNIGTTPNANTSFDGCRLNFNSTTKCLEFTF